MHDIVGAVIGGAVTTDRLAIDAALALGLRVTFVSRRAAVQATRLDPNCAEAALADAPTLFMSKNGVRYRRIAEAAGGESGAAS